MLLAILALYLASDPHTFDMRELIARQPLAGSGLAGLALLGFAIGFGIKTPCAILDDARDVRAVGVRHRRRRARLHPVRALVALAQRNLKRRIAYTRR